jgi:hypothetical protein
MNNGNQFDDSDEIATSTSGRQDFIVHWQSLIAFGPFAALILFSQTPISNALPNWMAVPLIIATVIWAVAFKGYVLYLTKYLN